MVAEFEFDLVRARTCEGMQVAEAKGHLRGKQPQLSTAQQRHLMEVHRAGTHSTEGPIGRLPLQSSRSPATRALTRGMGVDLCGSTNPQRMLVSTESAGSWEPVRVCGVPIKAEGQDIADLPSWHE